MFMHIGGTAGQESLAAAVGKVFAKIKETSGGAGETAKADIDPAKSTLTPAKIEAALGYKGDLASGVYEVTIGRTTRMHGHEAQKTMGWTPGRPSPAPTTARWWTAISRCWSRSFSRC
jgi:hypothetical protein